MELTVFKSSARTEILGITPEPSGANLPVHLAPWRRTGIVILRPEMHDVQEALDRDGFFLLHVAQPSDHPLPSGTIH